MTTLFIYSIKSAFVLVLLYAPYALLLHHEKCLRRNRMTLLAILGLSLLLPLCNVSSWSMDNQPLVHRAQVQMLEVGIPIHMVQDEADVVEAQSEPELGATQLLAEQNTTWPEGTPIVPISEATEEPASHDWFQIVSILFAIGMTLVLGVRLAQFCRMGVVIRRGSLWQEKADGINIYCHSEQVPPFSWLNNIVIGEKDYDSNGREIILHEEGHIRHCHSLDIVLLTMVQMLQWWNPFVFLLARNLRDVHEYEADDYVLRQGIDPHTYQLLLLQTAASNLSFPLVNRFNHSIIKNRIKMMCQQKPHPWMRSKILYVIPLAMLALSVFATPSIIQPIEETVATLSAPEPQGTTDAPKGKYKRAVEYVTTQTIKGRPVTPYYLLHHEKGTWIVDANTNSSYIDEANAWFGYCYSDKKHIIKVDGITYRKDSVPDFPSTAVKKIEFYPEGEKTVINLVTKDVIIPSTVKDNVPRVQTIVIYDKNRNHMEDGPWPVGDWSPRPHTSWLKGTSFNMYERFSLSKDKPDLKVYIQASTDVPQETIDRTVNILKELGIKNYEIIKDIPIHHWSDDEYRAWAEKQKALGVKYSVSALRQKLISENVDLREMTDMRRWNRVIRPVFKP